MVVRWDSTYTMIKKALKHMETITLYSVNFGCESLVSKEWKLLQKLENLLKQVSDISNDAQLDEITLSHGLSLYNLLFDIIEEIEEKELQSKLKYKLAGYYVLAADHSPAYSLACFINPQFKEQLFDKLEYSPEEKHSVSKLFVYL